MDSKAYCITDKKYCKAYVNALFPAGKWIAGITIALSIINFTAIIELYMSDWEKARDVALVLIFLLINNVFLSFVFSLIYVPFYASVKSSKSARLEYTFSDDEFKITTFFSDESSKTQKPVKYSSLEKVKKRKHKIIILQSKFTVHIIENENLTGNPEELYLAIKNKIGDKKSGSK